MVTRQPDFNFYILHIEAQKQLELEEEGVREQRGGKGVEVRKSGEAVDREGEVPVRVGDTGEW